MKLWVRVVEARNLRAMDYLNGLSDPYVRLKIAEKKFRTKVVKRSLNPSWGEEFSFEVNELDEELHVCVLDQDKYFKNDLVGQLKLHIETVYDAPNKSLGTVWYTLQPKSKKSKHKHCGEILLSILFSERNPFVDETLPGNGDRAPRYMDRYADLASESSSLSLNDILGLSIGSPSRSSSSTGEEETTFIVEENSYEQISTVHPTQFFLRNGETAFTNNVGFSLPGSPETSKFVASTNNRGFSVPGSPATSKFVASTNNRGFSVPGSPETPKFTASTNIRVFSAPSSSETPKFVTSTNNRGFSVPGSPETPKFVASTKNTGFSVPGSPKSPKFATSSKNKGFSAPCSPKSPKFAASTKNEGFSVPGSPNSPKFAVSINSTDVFVPDSPAAPNFAPFTDSTDSSVPDSPEIHFFEMYGSSVYERKIESQYPACEFNEAIRSMESKDKGVEVPCSLSGGVLVDESYLIAPSDLNILLFSSESNFMSSLADMKGSRELQQELWRFESDGESLIRTVTYMKAPTKLMKAVMSIEEQRYLKANGEVFAVLVSASTPDAMYGSTFTVETLYCITPGPKLSSGEKSSRLVISWRMNFLQSTMMKGMIEGGARKVLTESFEKFRNLLSENVKSVGLKDFGSKPEIYSSNVYESKIQNLHSDGKFDEAMRSMKSKDKGVDAPSNLPGGVLVDQSCMVAPSDLNVLLFSSESNFTNSLADKKGNKELKQEPWRFGNDGVCLKRTVTYMKAATKMMKAVKAIEEQTYLKADGKVFAVLVSVSTPDATYGSTFKAETLYCITPGPELSSGLKSSRLVISWRMNFLQSTMMKGMIEGGARKALKESFEQFTSLLSQNVKLVGLKDLGSKPETYGNNDYESKMEMQDSDGKFNKAMRSMESKDEGEDIPNTLQGGVLVDQSYVITPSDLNILLFSSESKFTSSLANMKGNKELKQDPWMFRSDGESLKRTITYTKAATKMMKAMKAIEEQTYLIANGKAFAVLVSVSTPDAMYGNTFRAETLYCITPGPDLPLGERSSRLVISWRINFLQSTMMKGMIEGGARKALKETFEKFTDLLSQNVKMVDLKDLGSNKEHILASLQVEKQLDSTLATRYLLNFTVVSTAFLGLYLLMHILLSMPRTFQGLEFSGIDLPDSIAEIIVCTILVLQVQRALPIVSCFMRARVQKGSDHGVKAHGDGWVLTIALIEGSSLAAVDSTGFSDPYVIFTCNGKTKTSSIKFQQLDPHWNEVFEFDAMDEPPSILEMEVIDFDGPFDEAISLGHAEINFVKSNISDLADLWIPLQGKLSEDLQSKLHLKIFLDNTKGNNAIKEYLTKMEKEVGKKINVSSPQANTAFQTLFGLPPEEFLINDFTCRLKRIMLLQGRIFLSARIIGFHANLFGNKTTFFFLWEDIEDIQVLSPTLTSMGSPSLIIILWRGRGLDARHGAKKEDEEGRLKFHFHSFVSFNVAHRTIMALWKAKFLSPEQKMKIVEEESDAKEIQSEESGSLLDLEDASMSEVYSSAISVPMKFFMELFGGGYLDCKVMEKVGCLDYSHTSWESVKPDIYQRQISYKFDKNVSHYEGEATSTQQLSTSSEGNGWVVEEVLTLHGIPLGDCFTVHIRYQVEDLPKSKACNVELFFGIAWLKSTKHEKRLTKNISSNVVDRLKAMFSHVEREYIQET